MKNEATKTIDSSQIGSNSDSVLRVTVNASDHRNSLSNSAVFGLAREQAWAKLLALADEANEEAFRKLRDEEVIDLPPEDVAAYSRNGRRSSHE